MKATIKVCFEDEVRPDPEVNLVVPLRAEKEATIVSESSKMLAMFNQMVSGSIVELISGAHGTLEANRVIAVDAYKDAKAKKLAEEQARKAAEEKAKQEAAEKARKDAEEKKK
jgi:hypothetical protein